MYFGFLFVSLRSKMDKLQGSSKMLCSAFTRRQHCVTIQTATSRTQGVGTVGCFTDATASQIKAHVT